MKIIFRGRSTVPETLLIFNDRALVDDAINPIPTPPSTNDTYQLSKLGRRTQQTHTPLPEVDVMYAIQYQLRRPS